MLSIVVYRIWEAGIEALSLRQYILYVYVYVMTENKFTLIFPRTPLASSVWATKSRNSVSSSADITIIVKSTK